MQRLLALTSTKLSRKTDQNIIKGDVSCNVPFFLSSNVKAEKDDIAVSDNIFFALAAHKSRFLDGIHAAQSDKVIKGHHLGTDEAALKIAVISRTTRANSQLLEKILPPRLCLAFARISEFVIKNLQDRFDRRIG